MSEKLSSIAMSGSWSTNIRPSLHNRTTRFRHWTAGHKDFSLMKCRIPSEHKKRKLVFVDSTSLAEQYGTLLPMEKTEECCDMAFKDVQSVLLNFRKIADTDRLPFHYNGNGLPHNAE